MSGKLESEVERGNGAAQLLRNSLFKEAFQVLSAYYVEEWVNTDPADAERRERLYVSVQVLQDIHAHIESVMRTGQMAGDEIDEAKKGRRVH
jgi:hypothetical protein